MPPSSFSISRGMVSVSKAAALALTIAFAGVSASNTAVAQTQQQQVAFGKSELTIKTKAGRYHPFTVELALNNDQRAHGLMFRTQMAADAGMLFDFGAVRPVAMWMENTVLPLDMLFIQQDGTVSHIRQNAVPYSREVIDSHGPVRYVLELNAGTTRKLGIRVGDKVIGQAIPGSG